VGTGPFADSHATLCVYTGRRLPSTLIVGYLPCELRLRCQSQQRVTMLMMNLPCIRTSADVDLPFAGMELFPQTDQEAGKVRRVGRARRWDVGSRTQEREPGLFFAVL